MNVWRALLTNPTLTLANSRVILRPIETGDIRGLSEIAFDTSIWEHNPGYRVTTVKELEKYIADAIKQKSEYSRIPFTILDQKTNRIVGTSSFYDISEKDRKLAIGYTWIGKEFQGKGVNSAIKSTQFDYAFNTLKCHRVEFKTDSKNNTSRNSILKHGCTQEGILRNHCIKFDGVVRDTVVFSIKDVEYSQQVAKLHIA